MNTQDKYELKEKVEGRYVENDKYRYAYILDNLQIFLIWRHQPTN